MDISLVIPAYNEDESLNELISWIDRVCTANDLSWEAILIDDGSTDNTWEVIEELAKVNRHIKGIKFRRNYGKSAAMNEGFQEAEGDVIITMDADMQDSPDEIPELRKMIIEGDYDLVSGWKQKRHDPIGKTIPSKFFNGTTRFMTGIQLHDFNCGLKAYKNEVVKNIEVYGEMHRYIPLIAQASGYRKIGEKVVEHRARKYGVTKFGWERLIKGFLDLLSILFTSKFGKQPMHLFGTLGTLSFLAGAAMTIWVVLEKIIRQASGMKFRDATDNPMFYIALVAVVIGVQLFVAGFLGQLVSRNDPERNAYQVSKRVGNDANLIA
ncbi:MAG: glycosyltransferase involved in cell wall biosynthesis [Limisphaerales bacterium]|jgi:glycosyltransferase involved in cell wall biosynthesis